MEIGGIPPQVQSVGAVRAAIPAALTQGAQYQAFVLGRDGETVEILIGNRTMFAKTALDLAPGSQLTLLLAEARPDMLLFRVLAESGASEGVLRVPVDTETLLTRLGVPVNRQTLDLAALLAANGVSVNANTMAIFARLAQAGSTHLNMLAAIYSSLVKEGVVPNFSTLAALAAYVATEPAIGELIDRLRKLKDRGRGARLRAAAEALVYEASEANPQALEDIAAFLYTPAESSLRRAIADARDARGSSRRDGAVTAGGAAIALASAHQLSEESAAELIASSAILAQNPDQHQTESEEAESALIETLLSAHIEAVNVLNSVSQSGFLAEMPVEIGGETTTVVLKTYRDNAAGYDGAITLLMTLDTVRLGAVEAYFRRHGASLDVEIYAEDDTTLALFALIASQSDFEKILGEATRAARARVKFAHLSRTLAILE